MSEENNLLVFPKIIKFMYFAATTFNHIKQFHRKLIKNLYRNIQLRWNIYFLMTVDTIFSFSFYISWKNWKNILRFLMLFDSPLSEHWKCSHKKLCTFFLFSCWFFRKLRVGKISFLFHGIFFLKERDWSETKNFFGFWKFLKEFYRLADF